MDQKRKEYSTDITEARKAVIAAMGNDVVMRGWRREQRTLELAQDALRQYDDERREQIFEEYAQLQQAFLQRHVQIAGEQSVLLRLISALLMLCILGIGSGIWLAYKMQPDPNVATQLKALVQIVEKSQRHALDTHDPIKVTLENLPPAPPVACTVTMPEEKKKRGRR